MKYYLGFGKKRGVFTESLQINMTRKQAARFISTLARSFMGDVSPDAPELKKLEEAALIRGLTDNVRFTWNNKTHFIVLTRANWADKEQPGSGTGPFWASKGVTI